MMMIYKSFITFSLMFIAFTTHGQTRESVMNEIKRQNIPHPEIVLAQARHETGNFTSKLCRVNHNLFGIKHNNKYARYARWQDSIKDYKVRISSRYTGGDYYRFLRRIHYASDANYERKIKHIIATSK